MSFVIGDVWRGESVYNFNFDKYLWWVIFLEIFGKKDVDVKNSSCSSSSSCSRRGRGSGYVKEGGGGREDRYD